MNRIIFKQTSPPRFVSLVLAVAFVVALVGLFIWNRVYPHAQVYLGTETFEARVADTNFRRTRGLSGTSSLGRNEAMVFTFPNLAPHGFWMKDMNYPIDIIWLSNGKVVDIAPRVPPGIGIADALLPSYIPRLPADTVVEVNAGTVDRLGVKIGDAVQVEAK